MSFAVRWLIAAALLLPVPVGAQPTTLKLSFFTSDRSVAYQTAVKPFVDAVNAEGSGLVEIKVYFSGTLGKVQKELPQAVLDDTADIAFVIPGQNPDRFTDNAVVELPGLFNNVREATLTYSRLVAADALAGYRDFFVIGAYATEPEIINTRAPMTSLSTLNGMRIRVNNPTQALALAKLGVLPRVLAFNETTPALSSGALDGATAPTAQLFDVGIGRLTSNHYYLATSAAPLALLMNRTAFDRLPKPAQNLIRKYSGDWTAARFIAAYEKINRKVSDQIAADPRRHIVIPSPADKAAAQHAFQNVADEWAARSVHNRVLLNLAEAELAKIRADDASKARAATPKD